MTKYTGYYDTNEAFYTVEAENNDLVLGDVLEVMNEAATLRAELDAVKAALRDMTDIAHTEAWDVAVTGRQLVYWRAVELLEAQS